MKKGLLFTGIFLIITVVIFSATESRAETEKVVVKPLDNGAVGAILESNIGGTPQALKACIPDDVLARYPDTIESNTKTAQCRTGQVRHSLLAGEITDLQYSLSEINKRIQSVQKVVNYLNNKNTVDKLRLSVIPAGQIDTRPHYWANDISMMCVVTTVDKLPVKEVKAVGNKQKDNLSWYNPLPESQINLLKKFERDNQALGLSLDAERKANGKYSKKSLLSLALKLKDLRSTMQKMALPILDEDLPLYSSIDKNYISTVAVDYNLGADGKKIMHEVSTLFKVMTGEGLYVDVTFNFAGASYKNTWVPEKTLLTSLREDTQKQLNSLIKMKDEIEKHKKVLVGEYNELEAKNYNCI